MTSPNNVTVVRLTGVILGGPVPKTFMAELESVLSRRHLSTRVTLSGEAPDSESKDDVVALVTEHATLHGSTSLSTTPTSDVMSDVHMAAAAITYLKRAQLPQPQEGSSHRIYELRSIWHTKEFPA